jgi:hypothetical protein
MKKCFHMLHKVEKRLKAIRSTADMELLAANVIVDQQYTHDFIS